MTLAVIEQQQTHTYPTDRGDVSLSLSLIKQTICPTATDVEAYAFLEHCVRLQANPYLREIYLIKYGGNPAQIVVGKDYFVKRAAQHPQYAGFHAGVIAVNKAGAVIYREGAMTFPGEQLWGGWCDVVRRDWPKPLRFEALLSEYTTGQSNWKSKPATMICKVPISQAHRAAFPELFQTMYGAEELGLPVTADGDPAQPYARIGPMETVLEVAEEPEQKTPPSANNPPRQQQQRQTPPSAANDRQARIDAAAAMKEAREALGMSVADFTEHVQGQYDKGPQALTLPEIVELTQWLKDEKAMQEPPPDGPEEQAFPGMAPQGAAH